MSGYGAICVFGDVWDHECGKRGFRSLTNVALRTQ